MLDKIYCVIGGANEDNWKGVEDLPCYYLDPNVGKGLENHV